MSKIGSLVNQLLFFWLIPLFISSCGTTPSDYTTEADSSKISADTVQNKKYQDDKISLPLLHIGNCKCNKVPSYDDQGKLQKFDQTPKSNDNDAVVCIDVDDFSTEVNFGGDPPVYEVPLFICATGTVDKIYVNNVEVKFQIDERSFVKVNMPLGDRVNKIPVKIISKKGAIKEDFLEFKGTQKIENPDKQEQ